MARRDKRKIKRVKARVCRFQCGNRFDASFDVDRSHTCPECRPLLVSAIVAVNAIQLHDVFGDVTYRPRPIRVQLLIKRIKKHRVEFESACRLGADRGTLCTILGWKTMA